MGNLWPGREKAWGPGETSSHTQECHGKTLQGRTCFVMGNEFRGTDCSSKWRVLPSQSCPKVEQDELGGSEFPRSEDLNWDGKPTIERCCKKEPRAGGAIDPQLEGLGFIPSSHYNLTSC